MRIAWSALAAALLLAACAPAANPTTVPATLTPVPPTAAAAAPTVVSPSPTMEAVDARPAWQSIVLQNARTGESFTMADFAGRTVFVHPMAKW